MGAQRAGPIKSIDRGGDPSAHCTATEIAKAARNFDPLVLPASTGLHHALRMLW